MYTCKLCNIMMKIEDSRLFCPACGFTLITKTCYDCWENANLWGIDYCTLFNEFVSPGLGCHYYEPNRNRVNTNWWHDVMGWKMAFRQDARGNWHLVKLKPD